MSTVWLQIFMKQYFRDFHEFHNDHENFCHEIFLKQLIVQDLTLQNHEKSMNHENMQRSRKYKTTKIWSYTVTLLPDMIPYKTNDHRY